MAYQPHVYRKKRHRVLAHLLGFLVPLAALEFVYFSAISPSLGNNVPSFEVTSDGILDTAAHYQGRHLLQESASNTTPATNCTERSIHQFPADFMSREQRRNGGIVFHIVLSLYLFVAIAIACDDFFVPAIEKICFVLEIRPDVAGATFMAAGSSAPEFFAAVIGIFFAKSDIGLSTIVGSAVFNLLLVNAVVGMFTGAVIYLTWWPVMRDCAYYLFSVIVLIIVMSDETVRWYEGLIMVILYAVYVALMYFNERVHVYMMDHVTCCLDNRAKQPNGDSSSEDGNEGTKLLPMDRDKTTEHTAEYGTKDPEHKDESGEAEEFESPLTFPDGCWRRFLWIIMLPITFLMTITTPDFRRGGCWAKLYVLTFIISCLWIALLCYVLVWFVTITGDTLNIPDTVMGLTLLAIGTSVPDAVASLLVAQDGFGDMAVSNSVGSNVFDILLCLGLPWLLQTGVITPGVDTYIDSKGLTYATITLIGTIVFLVVGLWANRWRLDVKFGILCLVMYVVVTALACLCEMNVFGFVNLPMCPY